MAEAIGRHGYLLRMPLTRPPRTAGGSSTHRFLPVLKYKLSPNWRPNAVALPLRVSSAAVSLRRARSGDGAEVTVSVDVEAAPSSGALTRLRVTVPAVSLLPLCSAQLRARRDAVGFSSPSPPSVVSSLPSRASSVERKDILYLCFCRFCLSSWVRGARLASTGGLSLLTLLPLLSRLKQNIQRDGTVLAPQSVTLLPQGSGEFRLGASTQSQAGAFVWQLRAAAGAGEGEAAIPSQGAPPLRLSARLRLNLGPGLSLPTLRQRFPAALAPIAAQVEYQVEAHPAAGKADTYFRGSSISGVDIWAETPEEADTLSGGEVSQGRSNVRMRVMPPQQG